MSTFGDILVDFLVTCSNECIEGVPGYYDK